jgi:hypothetical protein
VTNGLLQIEQTIWPLLALPAAILNVRGGEHEHRVGGT